MRDVVETEDIDNGQLDGVYARLEKDADSTKEIEHTGSEAKKIIRYKFDREVSGDEWYGQIDIEVYDESFQARGDEVIVSKYFADNRIQELKIE